MQNLTALNHDIDIAQKTLRCLREHQRFLDTQSYRTPSEIFVLASVKPAPLPKVSEFLNERFLEERKADLDSLPEVIERASLSLCVAQAQIELAWRENQTSGLAECIKKDEAFARTLFFAAVIRKGSLVDQGKLQEPDKGTYEEELRKLQHDISNVLSTSQSLRVNTDQQLLDSIFILRRSFVESSLRDVGARCVKIQAQHTYIDSLIEEAGSKVTPESATTWTEIEKERRDSHRSLLSCEHAMRRIEAYTNSFYDMGSTSHVDHDFEVVRYVPAPLNALDPNTP